MKKYLHILLSGAGTFLVFLSVFIIGGVEDGSQLQTSVITAPFSDVLTNHKYVKAISFLKQEKVIEGYSDGTFKPENFLNRAEFTKIVVMGTSQPFEKAIKAPFPDVPLGQWYTDYVAYAAYWEFVNGYPDGTFKPEQQINKVEALKILGELVGWKTMSSSIDTTFKDVNFDEWYGKYLAYAIDKNIIDDQGKYFNPTAFITRGQLSEYIYRDYIVREYGLDRYEPQDGDMVITPVEPTSVDYAVSSVTEEQYNYLKEKIATDIIEDFKEKNDLVAFVHPLPYAAGTTIGAYDFSNPSGQKNVETLKKSGWLVFVDLYPSANWNHPTKFIILDYDKFEYKIREEDSWPVVNGMSLWSNAEMRNETEFWAYSQNGNETKLESGGEPATANTPSSFVVASAGNDFKFISQLFASSQNVSANSFESKCPFEKKCENKPKKKIALVIDGIDEANRYGRKDGDEIKSNTGTITTKIFKEWDTLQIYKGLKSQGYDTIYLAGEFESGLSDIPAGVAKGDARYTTLAGVAKAFEDMAAKITGCCDDVVVVISGHGDGESIAMNPRRSVSRVDVRKEDGKWVEVKVDPVMVGSLEGGDLSSTQIRNYLNTLKSCRQTVVFSSCYSGGLLDKVVEVDEGCQCRTAYSSSTADELTWAGSSGFIEKAGLALQSGNTMSKALFSGYLAVSDRGPKSNFPQVKSSKTDLCEDADGDGICSGLEMERGTKPDNIDTDGDGLTDGEEWEYDPTLKEITDPLNPDTDEDELIDGEEYIKKTDPFNPDSDGDKVSDGKEVKFGTNPLDQDTDHDGLHDYEDIYNNKTNPLNPDTDGDGCSDGQEVNMDKTDPSDPKDHGVGCEDKLVTYKVHCSDKAVWNSSIGHFDYSLEAYYTLVEGAEKGLKKGDSVSITGRNCTSVESTVPYCWDPDSDITYNPIDWMRYFSTGDDTVQEINASMDAWFKEMTGHVNSCN